MIQQILVHDAPTPREAAPMLLDALWDRDPEKARWIEDVYSEVFKALRQNEIDAGHEMVVWLMEALSNAFQDAAPEGCRFIHQGAVYGYING